MTEIAFVCVENAGRSQMAAGFARTLAPHDIEIISGGTRPARAVDPTVVAVMKEVGIDLSRETPRRIGPEDLAHVDVVVTMGCSADDVCPVGFRGDAQDWGLPDPKGRDIEEVRAIRDDIRRRVEELLREVVSNLQSKVR